MKEQEERIGEIEAGAIAIAMFEEKDFLGKQMLLEEKAFLGEQQRVKKKEEVQERLEKVMQNKQY